MPRFEIILVLLFVFTTTHAQTTLELVPYSTIQYNFEKALTQIDVFGMTPERHVIGQYPAKKPWWAIFVGTPGTTKNWFPINRLKNTMCGEVYDLAFHSIGSIVNGGADERDYIHYLPASGMFSDLASYPEPRREEWRSCSTDNSIKCVELEITPSDKLDLSALFFREDSLIHVGKNICGYGPWVREDTHNNHPEIHPSELMWWKSDQSYFFYSILDASKRFDDPSHYSLPDSIDIDWKPWATGPLDIVYMIAFYIDDPTSDKVAFSILMDDNVNSGLVDLESLTIDDQVDETLSLLWGGTSYDVVRINEMSEFDDFVAVDLKLSEDPNSSGRICGLLSLNLRLENSVDDYGHSIIEVVKNKYVDDLPFESEVAINLETQIGRHQDIIDMAMRKSEYAVNRGTKRIFENLDITDEKMIFTAHEGSMVKMRKMDGKEVGDFSTMDSVHSYEYNPYESTYFFISNEDDSIEYVLSELELTVLDSDVKVIVRDEMKIEKSYYLNTRSLDESEPVSMDLPREVLITIFPGLKYKGKSDIEDMDEYVLLQNKLIYENEAYEDLRLDFNKDSIRVVDLNDDNKVYTGQGLWKILRRVDSYDTEVLVNGRINLKFRKPGIYQIKLKGILSCSKRDVSAEIEIEAHTGALTFKGLAAHLANSENISGDESDYYISLLRDFNNPESFDERLFQSLSLKDQMIVTSYLQFTEDDMTMDQEELSYFTELLLLKKE